MMGVSFDQSAQRDANVKRYGWGGCRLCGKPLAGKRTHWIHEHDGGGYAVTNAEAAELDEGADLGYQPIGPDCWAHHPELHPYEVDPTQAY